MPLDTVEEKDKTTRVVIAPPNFQRANIRIIGTGPYMQHKFSQKAMRMMEERQRAGSRAKSSRKREARDPEADFRAAAHWCAAGWYGIPAGSMRSALIAACRLTEFAMTKAKLSIFIEADGYDADNRTPLIKLEADAPVMDERWARPKGQQADLRFRPRFDKWSAVVRVRWDDDQFGAADVANLIARAGLQVGIGEGRPGSPNSNGLDFGTWELAP